jgi:hypothetical protein
LINKLSAVQIISNNSVCNNFESRIRNLLTFSECCQQNDISYWLSGRTLLYSRKVNSLPDDEFDSVGIMARTEDNCRSLNNSLIALGFSLLKTTKWHVLLVKENRILEIEYFYPELKGVAYRELFFTCGYFEPLKQIKMGGLLFFIPNFPDEFIDEIYKCRNNEVFFSTSPKSHIKNRSIDLIKNLFKGLFMKMPIWFLDSFYSLGIKNGKIKKLTEMEFRSLYFEVDAVNLFLRKTHLDLITSNGKHKTVGEIIDYLKQSKNIERIKGEIRETPMPQPFLEPIYFNNKFWQTGNNYFINCILFSFRKNVVPYEQVNKYIDKIPALYTSDYYSSLEPMHENEIIKLLKQPLIICNDELVGGRHRVCAMIGRMVSDEKYIPFKSLNIPRSTA